MLGNVWIEALQLLGSSLRQELIGSISFLASSFHGLGSDPQLGSMWSVKYFTSAIVNISGDVWNRTVEFLVSDPRLESISSFLASSLQRPDSDPEQESAGSIRSPPGRGERPQAATLRGIGQT